MGPTSPLTQRVFQAVHYAGSVADLHERIMVLKPEIDKLPEGRDKDAIRTSYRERRAHLRDLEKIK